MSNEMSDELANFLDSLKEYCDSRTLPFDETDPKIIKALNLALKDTLGNREDEVNSARDEGYNQGHSEGVEETKASIKDKLEEITDDLG